MIEKELQPLIPSGRAWIRPVMRRFANRLLWLRFVLTQRHRYNRLSLGRLGPFRLLVLPQVFNPCLFPSSRVLLDHLQAHPIERDAAVLDLGCGSGICGLAAASTSTRVVCSDINPEAVRCAHINALLNGVADKVRATESDLFSAFKNQHFDVVLFNPPFFRGRAEQVIDKAWRSEDVLERFARNLGDHLAAEGYALVVFSTDGDLTGLLRALLGAGLRVELAAAKDTVNEVVVLYKVTR